MATFTPRKTRPANDNLYYIKTTKGGYNKCIQIQSDGRVLPNCTGYAWGRFMECQPNVHNCNLSRMNAELWYPYTADGYERGQTPKLGAVICWHSTRSGGHVAIVEEIKANGDIVTSNSAYSGSYFYMKTLKAPNYYMGQAYTFQGFIYNPTSFEPTPPTPPTPTTSKKSKFPWFIYSRKLRINRN
jgi:surface antigen